jgi:hypothetical protein
VNFEERVESVLEYFDLPVDPNHQGHQVGPDGDDEKD